MIELPLTNNAPASSHGGCACGCGGHGAKAQTEQAAAEAPGAVRTELAVTGMTCGHCVSSVREELGELDGVQDVDVALVAGGVSTVTVTSVKPLDDAALRAAIDEAGYALAE
ncbi:heavy-metal-associated domain-containing protein [Herbiconiux sp. SYSU D00978]|uniref:heavy-metal-associated domain-containing protein n=1 Tax=Herbiconiux sp. SYSU D00978 TaxID=2812562 RepID=UPI001A95F745|nr:heavy-metal-associated domain-containing protein [Herbiconiux sp. SYSU D00978]